MTPRKRSHNPLILGNDPILSRAPKKIHFALSIHVFFHQYIIYIYIYGETTIDKAMFRCIMHQELGNDPISKRVRRSSR